MPMPPLGRLKPWLPPLLLMAVIFLLSAQSSLDSGLGLLDLIGRKLIHFTSYALLCFLWWRALAGVTTPGRAVLLALLLSSAYAATDEYHQSFVDGRSGNVVDWAIDTAGATLAALRLRAGLRRRTTA
jgi:VanZ family protein